MPRDPEIEALMHISESLEALDGPARERVLTWCLQKYPTHSMPALQPGPTLQASDVAREAGDRLRRPDVDH